MVVHPPSSLAFAAERLVLAALVCGALAIAACGDSSSDGAIDATAGGDIDASGGGVADAASDRADAAPAPQVDAAPPDGPPFGEIDGYIVMEIESVAIASGQQWQSEADLAGYTGDAFYRFVGNGICNGPARSPLVYEFRVGRAATYQLHLRAAKLLHCVAGAPEGNGHCSESDRTCTSLGEPVGGRCPGSGQCVRTDISNDAFVSMWSGTDYVAFDDQPGGTVGDPIKLFGGAPNAWAWTGSRALDTAGRKWDARWTLAPGDYRLVIEGRSREFRLDRMILFDVATGSLDGAVQRPETRSTP